MLWVSPEASPGALLLVSLASLGGEPRRHPEEAEEEAGRGHSQHGVCPWHSALRVAGTQSLAEGRLSACFTHPWGIWGGCLRGPAWCHSGFAWPAAGDGSVHGSRENTLPTQTRVW